MNDGEYTWAKDDSGKFVEPAIYGHIFIDGEKLSKIQGSPKARFFMTHQKASSL